MYSDIIQHRHAGVLPGPPGRGDQEAEELPRGLQPDSATNNYYTHTQTKRKSFQEDRSASLSSLAFQLLMRLDEATRKQKSFQEDCSASLSSPAFQLLMLRRAVV